MGFLQGDTIDVPLKAHPGTLHLTSWWTTDGLSNIFMNFVVLENLNVLDAKAAVYNAQNVKVAEAFAGGRDPYSVPIGVNVPESAFPDTASAAYGDWSVSITLKIGTTWVYDGNFPFSVVYTAAPPPPPPPPDPCAFCAPGTHCEGGLCVPDPPPPPPPPEPGWLEKLKALFPVQLAPYAVPITIGVVVLAYQGFKKK